MFELMLVGGAYALGSVLTVGICYLVGALVTWPWRLMDELAAEKQWHANTKEYLKTAQENRR